MSLVELELPDHDVKFSAHTIIDQRPARWKCALASEFGHNLITDFFTRSHFGHERIQNRLHGRPLNLGAQFLLGPKAIAVGHSGSSSLVIPNDLRSKWLALELLESADFWLWSLPVVNQILLGQRFCEYLPRWRLLFLNQSLLLGLYKHIKEHLVLCRCFSKLLLKRLNCFLQFQYLAGE